mmetsp:Transcript_106411/g.159151  ORF Transcript_106411/g.159151 Transcript_106411/m.159151 type:complete len:131 (+) Transcript_106411:89-481(+)|eukprot:CAMPEP_0117041646 /NCGR_PEP_ID=MMETSP0472-20121206/29061_1 /TAXON_ID=693140 ORGANISM="Tiarina fusus, Strain LIS" /NCGR_SAMPLE_ID=MMETSP0472 /ASSEMBLY_ACC=CAM_ASM_000603 /LENGTH=130 /DNA_ID=CAMNT_0004752693 /DNA_START=79 /DNA_END=471 /DNA_ORIENTATION=+
MILGSGLGSFADDFEEKIVIPYNKIPYFLVPTTVGHAGNLVVGKKGKHLVAAMQGRFHYYEGHDILDCTFPVRVFKMLNIGKIMITSAVGGINESYEPGDCVLVKDHINLMGINPLLGSNDSRFGPRFPD